MGNSLHSHLIGSPSQLHQLNPEVKSSKKELHPMLFTEISNDLRAVSHILINVPFVLAVATYQRVSRHVANQCMVGI